VAKIKKILNTEGKVIAAGSLGMPVVIYGFPSGVSIGELVQTYETAKEAVNAASMETAKKVAKKGNILQTVAVTEGQINLVLKADVAGSLEALKETILKIPQENTTITIKSATVGSVTESDVEFAKTSQSTILAFHTNLLSGIAKQIETDKVNLVQSDIIYELLNWIEEQILANTRHEIKITILGKLKVLALFKSDKNGVQVFGGEVLDGKVFSNKQLRIAGSEGQNFEIVELQRNKEKVKEVNAPQQFGVSVSGKAKIKVGDELECFDETVILHK
jgi:translation initiation factor IF-2